MSTVESRGVTKLLAKIKDSLDEKHYYEAHQIYRTIYFRYSKQEKFQELADLLLDGASQLLSARQFQSGCDLALLLVEILGKCKLGSESEREFEKWITAVSGLIERIESNVVERETLVVRAVKWSTEGNKLNPNQGHPLMHKLIAGIMAKEQSYEDARYHYLLSKDGIGCAKILIQLSSRAFNNEADLVIVQVVLNLLVLKEKDTALVTFDTYTKLHPKIRTANPPFRTPLLNFLYFLLNIIDDAQLSSFKTLCELYKTALSRDPAYEKQLQQIGVSYFGAPRAKPVRQNGLFGDLFSQLFEELEGDSDDEDPQPGTASGSTIDLD